MRSIAEEMGAVLIRASFSANIKERRDCSTALFDERGRMIAQAEHIPVHLGALPDAVAAVRAREPGPDDMFILNDPYAGGTHLPDITLVSRTAVGFAATRAHHADVGAAEPGSLPAGSRRLNEEGVVIPPTRLDEATLDAPGTAPQHQGNLNCPLAVTRSACYFVVRCLTDPDTPASGGAFAPVTVRAPEGSLVNARPPAAVVAGNVETSSRVADVVLLAFGEAIDIPAQGQGTMNNVTLGNDRFTYYETIGGGQGACPDGDGPSAVHVAMSNTLSTPAEALELAYPIRVARHALRRCSGGDGRHHGGDGIVRELRVLESCRLSILSERRRRAPQGRKGGEPGATGRNFLNGEELPAKVARDLGAGDVVRIETPGGGGYGSQD